MFGLTIKEGAGWVLFHNTTPFPADSLDDAIAKVRAYTDPVGKKLTAIEANEVLEYGEAPHYAVQLTYER